MLQKNLIVLRASSWNYMEGPSGAVHRMLRFKMEISVCLVVTNLFHCHRSPVARCLQEVVQIYKDTMMGYFFPSVFLMCSGYIGVAVLQGEVTKGSFCHTMCESAVGFYIYSPWKAMLPFAWRRPSFLHLLALFGVMFKKELQYLHFSAFYSTPAFLSWWLLQ